jgi:lipoprotein signal peptidase
LSERVSPFRRLLRRLLGERRVTRTGGRRRTDFEPNRGWLPVGAIALLVATSDWAVKWLVAQRLPLHGFEVVWPDRVALWHLRNDAMILGLYGNLPLVSRQVIAALSGIVGALLLFEVVGRGHRLPPRRRKWAWLFVGLASGGMLGNLGERVVHWGVTDYLSFRWEDLWLPPGNIADLAIFASMPVALLVIYFELAARLQRADETEVEGGLTGNSMTPTRG